MAREACITGAPWGTQTTAAEEPGTLVAAGLAAQGESAEPHGWLKCPLVAPSPPTLVTNVNRIQPTSLSLACSASQVHTYPPTAVWQKPLFFFLVF